MIMVQLGKKIYPIPLKLKTTADTITHTSTDALVSNKKRPGNAHVFFLNGINLCVLGRNEKKLKLAKTDSCLVVVVIVVECCDITVMNYVLNLE